MKIFSFYLILSLISACSFAPLRTEKTARSLKKGTWELDGGLALAPYVSGKYGLTDNLDVTMIGELQTFPVWATSLKYSLLNKEKGFSLALDGGVFSAMDFSNSYGFYAGPILSIKYSWFETYLASRFNYVHWTLDLRNENGDDLFFDLSRSFDEDVTYYQHVIGFNFWFSQKFALNINAKALQFINDVVDEDDPIFTGGIGFLIRP